MTRPTLEDRIENIHQRFLAKNGGTKASDPTEPTPMILAISQIQAYDHNPRRERNAAYDRIKESIRQRGFVGTLPITQRPGDTHYMVAEGGNTVLHILKELYAETQDPRYAQIRCLFQPWVSESETLIAHLVENDARGDLIFIDRAQAVHDLRRLLEHETGQRLSTRALASASRERGYSLDPTTISRIDYTVEVLLPVIPQALRSALGRPVIDRLRKLENQLNERQMASMYLKGMTAEIQQALLDELGAKLRHQTKTIHPVRNPIGLLAWMCQAARAGQPPLTSAHLQYRAIRERERLVAEHDEAERRRLTEMALGKVGPAGPNVNVEVMTTSSKVYETH